MDISDINKVRDRIFICSKCGNRTLVPMEEHTYTLEVDYHDLCICEECAAELLAEPQWDGTVKFVDSGEQVI